MHVPRVLVQQRGGAVPADPRVPGDAAGHEQGLHGAAAVPGRVRGDGPGAEAGQSVDVVRRAVQSAAPDVVEPQSARGDIAGDRDGE